MTKPILCYGKIGLSHCELKRHSLNLKNATAFLLQNHNFNQKCYEKTARSMRFWCTFGFSQNLLTSRKLEKNLRKFFPFSKFTKLVNGDSGNQQVMEMMDWTASLSETPGMTMTWRSPTATLWTKVEKLRMTCPQIMVHFNWSMRTSRASRSWIRQATMNIGGSSSSTRMGSNTMWWSSWRGFDDSQWTRPCGMRSENWWACRNRYSLVVRKFELSNTSYHLLAGETTLPFLEQLGACGP